MAERTFTLTQQQYEALLEFARRGASTTEEQRRLSEFARSIETANGVTREGIWIQWQEMNQPLPAGTNFPETWPPEMRYWLEIVGRAISRADVDAIVANEASAPINVLCTRDPAARVGWTAVDDFFVG